MVKALTILEQELPNYITEVKGKHSENAKAIAFTMFIQKVFNVESKDLDFEVPIKTVVMELKGRIDAVFGNLIIEFKKDLRTGLDDAKTELEKYFQAYHEKFSDSKFIGLATDGIRFKVFHPKYENNVVREVEEIDSLDIENNSAYEIFLWFDAYFFASDKITPTAEDIKKRFGLESPTFAIIVRKLGELFEKVKIFKPAMLKYESWNRYLEIVYGDKPNELGLFFTHTYLSTFVKLLVHVKLSGGKPSIQDEVVPILYGNTFSKAGIVSFLEEDFFSWIMSVPIRKQSSKLFYDLLREIYIYDLERIDEDVLKELYQELVEPDVRKLLGEFYTPDWLATLMVNDTLKENPTKSVMDPSCGSGTFLFKVIQHKIMELGKRGWDKTRILNHILDNVIGFDVHPLAVVIARTNYLLALKDILSARTGSISIPVYLSDSLKIPTKTIDVSTASHAFEFSALDKKFRFPTSIASDITKMDEAVERLRNYGQEFENHLEKSKTSSYPFIVNEYTKNMISNFEKTLPKNYSDEEKRFLTLNLDTLYDLIKNESDAIWPYVLRNMYKPVAIVHRRIDLVIGNPPWISLRYMKNEVYQNFVKEKSKQYDIADDYNFQNMANLELASVFFYHCVDNYLANDGVIAFVMPQSVIIASQHQKFRKFANPKMKLLQVYDLEYVEPLFRIPSCVLICQKDKETKYPVKILRSSGKLPSNNMQLDNAKDFLKFEKSEFTPVIRKVKGGYYYDLFKRGAEITPRNFWFIDIKSNKFLSYNPMKPYVVSSENKDAKKPWNEIKVEGNIEREFFFNTVLGPDLIPFGIMKRRLIVLPVKINQNEVKMLNSNSPEIQQFDFAKYLANIEALWKTNATDKLKKKPIYEQVNYNDNLIQQQPQSKYKVIYAANGANMTCAVIESKADYVTNVDDSKFMTNTFFADMAMYYYNTESEDEAFYLCSILNSNTVNEFIKPLQSRGDFGARNIHKAPLIFDIPQFDKKNSSHIRLAKIGKAAQDDVMKIIHTLDLKSIGKIRSVIREKISDKLNEVDILLKNISKDN